MGIEAIYNNIWLWSTFFFCLIIFLKYVNSTRCTLLQKKKVASAMTIIYCVVFAIWIGLRPMDLAGWGDSSTYASYYRFMMGDRNLDDNLVVDTDSEWLWSFIMRSFVMAKVQVSYWFLFISSGYIGFMYMGLRRMMPNNQWIALLFCISSFSFLSFSYNGLRNGLACSIIIYAFSFYIKFDKKGLIIGLFLSFLALGIHRSSALPSLCALVAYFTKLNFKWAYSFWLLSILLSLIAGPQIQDFFASIGFDDRMKSYAGSTVGERTDISEGTFSHTGFRWDFLIYSAMPIVLGYYIVYKKRIKDKAYDFLIVTYILANSFWVMVIQAAYSNRFAYLSWFMYPIVFAYPLLKVKIWKDQDRKTVQILMLYVLFTVFLNVIYW